MTFNFNMNNSNFQHGNNNTFINSNNSNKINWKNIKHDYLKIKEIEKAPELVEAIKKQSVLSFKEKIKEHIANYGINVLSNLSTTAILEILSMFL